MAQIRLDDAVHERLKAASERDKRSIGGQIEYLLDNILILEDIHMALSRTSEPRVDDLFSSEPEAAPKEPIAVAPPEHKSREIMDKINSLNKEIREADETNQDPDYWDVINKKKDEVQSLWTEWHEAMGR